MDNKYSILSLHLMLLVKGHYEIMETAYVLILFSSLHKTKRMLYVFIELLLHYLLFSALTVMTPMLLNFSVTLEFATTCGAPTYLWCTSIVS